jgi:DNA-binding MarR family transcriptional regulator
MPIDELYKMPGHLIRRAQQIAVSIFLEECAEFDLTPVQYAALFAINDTPGIDATRLSSVLAFDRSTLGNVLDRLENKKLVARSTTPDDKRVKVLRLTPKGQQVLATVEPLVVQAQQRILAPLSEADQKKFVTILEQLVELNNTSSRAPLRLASRS